MKESLADTLERFSSFLHWIEKYEECNEVSKLIAWLRENEVAHANQLPRKPHDPTAD